MHEKKRDVPDMRIDCKDIALGSRSLTARAFGAVFQVGIADDRLVFRVFPNRV